MIDAKDLEKKKERQRKRKIENKVCSVVASILTISVFIIGGRLLSLLFTFLIPELEDYGVECLIFFSIVLAFVICASILYRIRHMSVEDYDRITKENDQKEAERQEKLKRLEYEIYTRKAAKNCKRYINSNGL